MKKLWINETECVNLSDNPISLSQEIATRQRSMDFYALGMYLPNPDPVLKQQGKDIAVYTELLSDGHLGGCVTSREAGVKSLEWGIDRGKARSRQAKLIEDLFKNLDIDGIISAILQAPLFGYQPLEVMWEKVGNYIVPKDVVGKPPRWFVFNEDNEPRFRTKQDPVNGEALPDRKFLFARHKATYENPYGLAELSRCFWPITFKRGGLKFWVIFTEKYGMPFLIGKHPRGTDEKDNDALLEKLEAMVQDAVAVIPDDSSVEFLESGRGGNASSSQIYEKLIEMCKTEVSISILGQNLTTQVKGGSFAAAQSHMQVRSDIVHSDRKLVEKTLNELIGWVWSYNFIDGERPVFSMWEEEDVDKDLADRDKTLSDAGVRFTKAYYMKAYGFAEEDIEVGAPPKEGAKQRGEFSEGKSPDGNSAFPDQQAVDDFIEALSSEKLQTQLEGVLKPVLDLINGSNDYQAVVEKLVETYPDMDTKGIEDMLAKAIFVAEAWGRISAEAEKGATS